MLRFIATTDPVTLFEPAFAQRALVATLLLAMLCGALGTVIVLRDLPFFTHAVGAGTYPVLVLAVAAGVSVAAAAPVGALLFAALLWFGGRSAKSSDSRTGILVAQALAVGAILSATVASSNALLAAPPETLLFGSVLTVDATALIVLAGAAAVAIAIALLFAQRWLAVGFDRPGAGSLGAPALDALLFGAIAMAVAAALPVTGSLLAGAMLVVPAATARLFAGRSLSMALGALAIASFDGIAGLYLSLAFDLPAGAAIAATACAVFALAATGSAMINRMRPRDKFRTAPALALIVTAATIAGCGSSTSKGGSGEPLVVATTPGVADIVKQVGGNSVFVSALLDPGVDPHEYDPKPSDIRPLASARVVFKSGGDLDKWLDSAVRTANSDRTPVDLSQAAVLDPESGKQFNAHWFLDPTNLAAAAQRVRDELIKANPNARETYRANATAYVARTRAVDAALKRCVENAGPIAIVTGHDDFDYLARRYNIEIAARLTSGGQSAPSLADVRDANSHARAAHAEAFVISHGESNRLAEGFADKAGLPVLELYSDSLAAPGEPAGTALGAVAFDVGKLVGSATGGEVKCPIPNAS